jgi:ribosome biogenesis protein SSF1/2
MKDYISVAGQLAVTHIFAISQTPKHVVLKIGRTSDGPTMHFRVNEYSLASQVRTLQKRPYDSHSAFLTAPLVVLNNFNQVEENHVKLMKTTFQHVFPTINVKAVRLTDCRRVVLFHYKKEEETVEIRHFAVRAKPTGISKSVKRVLEGKLPSLGHVLGKLTVRVYSILFIPYSHS